MSSSGKRLPRATIWLALPALIAASVVSVATGAAGASAANGKIQVCVSSNQSKTVKYTVHRSHTTNTISLKAKAGHSVCSASYGRATGTYQVTQLASYGTKVTKISVSPKGQTVANNTASSSARVAVSSSRTTKISFSNAKVKTSTPTPVPVPTPTPTPPPGPSDPGTGYLEVCKAAADQWVTGSFAISITDGSFSRSVNLPVGECTDALQVPVGTATITETPKYPFYLSDVTSNSGTLVKNLATSSATVAVASSSNSAVETRINLINATDMGSYKVCKTLTASSGDLITQGRNAFTFNTSYSLGGTTDLADNSVQVIVPTLGDTYCTPVDTLLPVGTKVSVTEVGASGVSLVSAGANPVSQDAGSSGSTVVLSIGPSNGSIVKAEFVNTAVGTVEICKQIDDHFWTGWYTQADLNRPNSGNSPYNGTPFQFSINGGSAITVKAGYCSAPITVPTGSATVQELATPNFQLEGFTATGPDGSSRILSGTNPITVSVPAGGVGNETLVTATNKVQTGQVKVCKITEVTPGYDYTFHTSFSVGGQWFSQDVTLTPDAMGPAGEVCSYLSSPLPLIEPNGDPIAFKSEETSTEFPTASNNTILVGPSTITYDGNGTVQGEQEAQIGDAPGNSYYLCANLGQGVNVVTFTNTSLLDP
jgi:hypothetical protein